MLYDFLCEANEYHCNYPLFEDIPLPVLDHVRLGEEEQTNDHEHIILKILVSNQW